MTINVPILKPAPVPNELSRPYWEAAAQGRLVLQCCSACAVVRHYPRVLCDVCYSSAVHWQPASGRGTLHSWTVAHHAFHPAFAAEVPYVLVTVDLEEGVRALGRWRGAVPGSGSGSDAPVIGIGAPVHGAFEAREGGVDLVFMASAL